MTTPPRIVHEELARWRLRDRGLEQNDAAEILECSAAAVSRMIRGVHRGDPELLERFVTVVLQMPLDLVAPYVAEEEAAPTT